MARIAQMLKFDAIPEMSPVLRSLGSLTGRYTSLGFERRCYSRFREEFRQDIKSRA
jgi:hypothetical protein